MAILIRVAILGNRLLDSLFSIENFVFDQLIPGRPNGALIGLGKASVARTR